MTTDPQPDLTVTRSRSGGSAPESPSELPKTLIRAFHKAQRTPTSAMSSSPMSDTANSSMTSLSNMDSRTLQKSWAEPVKDRSLTSWAVPLKPWITQTRSYSPLKHRRRLSKSDKGVSPLASSNRDINEIGSYQKGTPVDTKESITSISPSILRFETGPSGHQRGTSKASVIDRGRSMRRGEISLKQVLSRSLKRFPSADRTTHDLPIGVKSPYDSSKLSFGEMGRLKKQAEEQVARFEVLHENDVTILSKVCTSIQCTFSALTATGATYLGQTLRVDEKDKYPSPRGPIRAS